MLWLGGSTTTRLNWQGSRKIRATEKSESSRKTKGSRDGGEGGEIFLVLWRERVWMALPIRESGVVVVVVVVVGGGV